MDRRKMSSSELARRGQDVCRDLNSAAGDGPEAALRVAGAMLELSAYIPGEPISDSVQEIFVRTAAQVYCPDNPAGVR